MWWLFKKKKVESDSDESIWKCNYSDCVATDFLPDYSICRCDNNQNCRYITQYSGMMLCSHPNHKEYVPSGSEPFDLKKNPDESD